MAHKGQLPFRLRRAAAWLRNFLRPPRTARRAVLRSGNQAITGRFYIGAKQDILVENPLFIAPPINSGRIRMLKWVVFVSLSLVFILEVWLLLTWGPMLGTIWTVLWIIASFVLGLVLLRVQGVIKLVQIHRQLLAEEIPTRELVDLFLILLGAAMLILPGFGTDIFGLCMLVPPLRWIVRTLALALLRRLVPVANAGTMAPEPRGPVVEIFPEEESR